VWAELAAASSRHSIGPDASAGVTDGRLQRQIVTQRVVVGDVFPTAAQGIDALREQSAHIMRDAGSATAVAECLGNGAGQSDTFIGLPQQQHAGITADSATVERRFDCAAPDLPQRDGFNGTIWHRRFRLLFRLSTNNNALRHGIADLIHEISGLDIQSIITPFSFGRKLSPL
jgi:hypothetical protein